MSLTPEERAIAVIVLDAKDGARFGHLEALITSAIRQAENDKLEEAARVAEQAHLGMSCFVDAVDCGQFNSGVRHAAKAVRSLIQKD